LREPGPVGAALLDVGAAAADEADAGDALEGDEATGEAGAEEAGADDAGAAEVDAAAGGAEVAADEVDATVAFPDEQAARESAITVPTAATMTPRDEERMDFLPGEGWRRLPPITCA